MNYLDEWSTCTLQMMEDLVPTSLQSERPVGAKTGCRIEGSVRAEKVRIHNIERFIGTSCRYSQLVSPDKIFPLL